MKIHFTEHKTERRRKSEEGTHSELPLFHLLNDWVLLGILKKNSLSTGTIFDCVDLCHQVAVLQNRSMMIYSHLDLTKNKKKRGGEREIGVLRLPQARALWQSEKTTEPNQSAGTHMHCASVFWQLEKWLRCGLARSIHYFK